ncbi:MAG: cyclopropane-fatty-acyl-phospholipid synthase family protein [Nitrospira sp.]|nr:cyclopropane-fatty-acyl-phospholipid synthase family protein [Nitrospira sp.]MDH4329203.1 cyclopropane-fatty-acyl-phospholipid synthase family protein [Nitrospira sp.]MDH5252943.1 cyclopropane-fatty-acyl-phospholipid synthase family protein [Nitrospira sp.]
MMSHGGLSSEAAYKVVSDAVIHEIHRLAETVRENGGQPFDLVLPDGSRLSFGQQPRVVMAIRDPNLLPILAQPTLGALGKAFVDGQIDIDGNIMTAITSTERLADIGGSPVTARIPASMARHTPQQDRTDITYHYDVGDEFYRLWLDERMVYSCAYFQTGEETIDTAQVAKLDHICRKLRLREGERLLDVGCGWGGLILHAANHYGVHAVGITLSDNQLAYTKRRIAEAGLDNRVEALLLDYRDAPERFGAASFDKVSSIGMFEHVGLHNLPVYFGAVRRLLRERGLFLNHGFTSSDTDNRTVGSGVSEFMDQYVFPNSELPHLHLVIREMAAQNFEVYDVESLRPHYARTLAHWSCRLEERLDHARALVGEKTLRIWRAYLAGTSLGFTQGWMNVYQVLASRQEAAGPTELPLTRAWMYR